MTQNNAYFTRFFFLREFGPCVCVHIELHSWYATITQFIWSIHYYITRNMEKQFLSLLNVIQNSSWYTDTYARDANAKWLLSMSPRIKWKAKWLVFTRFGVNTQRLSVHGEKGTDGWALFLLLISAFLPLESAAFNHFHCKSIHDWYLILATYLSVVLFYSVQLFVVYSTHIQNTKHNIRRNLWRNF